MEKVADSRHTVAKIAEGTTAYHAGVIEQHLELHGNMPADNAQEYWKVVRPAIQFVTDSLPESNWKRSLQTYIDLADKEDVAEQKSLGTATSKKAKNSTTVK